jgi:type IV secretory pathway TraG/TraD family ATPase VirD4
MQGIIRAFRDRVGNNWTFRDLILAMLSEDACRILLSDTVQNRQLLASYIDGDERTSLNIRSTIQSLMMRFEPVATSWHKAAQAGRTIDLQQWSKSGSGYLVLGAQKTEDSAMESINRVLLNLLKRLWLEAPGTQPMPKHFLVMDELASAGKQTAISHLMNEGREKGVSVTLGFQDISDLYQTYGKDTAESMTAQASHKALLRMEGDVTPQWASRIAGEAEQFEYTYGSSQGESRDGWSKSKSTTEQRTRRAVLMPSDFTTLPRVTLEAGHTGYPAVFFHWIFAAKIRPKSVTMLPTLIQFCYNSISII